MAAGCAQPAASVAHPEGLPSPREALALLDALPRHRTDYYQVTDPYDRAYFGARWWDTDGNGRDTRDDVLAAQLLEVTLNAEGNVASGHFADPYTGLEVEYMRGRDEKDPVVVDHVVSLWEAWAAGAWAWTPEQRLEFANDPINLVATTYQANEDKGPQNVARWHPTTRLEECAFALRVAATKAKYGLEVHENDRDYLRATLSKC